MFSNRILFPALFCCARLMAQSETIPPNANIVFCAKLSSLSKKMDLNSLSKYSFMQLDSHNLNYASVLCKEFLKDPIGNGIELKGEFYVFQYQDTTANYRYPKNTTIYALPIKNYKKSLLLLERMYTYFSTQPRYNYPYAAYDVDTAAPFHNSFLEYNFTPKSQFLNQIKTKNSYYLSAPENTFAAVLSGDKLLILSKNAQEEYIPSYNPKYDDGADSIKATIDSIRFANLNIEEKNYQNNSENTDSFSESPSSNSELYYNNHPLFKAFIKSRIAKDSLEWKSKLLKNSNLLFKQLDYHMNLRGQESLGGKNQNFATKLVENNDLFVFINYEETLNAFQHSNKLNPPHLKLPKMLKNAYISYDGTFENGIINFHTHYNPGDSFYNLYKRLENAKINPMLFNSIPVQKPLGIIGTVYDFNLGIDYWNKYISTASTDAKLSASNTEMSFLSDYAFSIYMMFNIYYNMVDEKIKNQIFKGGVLFSVNGTTSFKKTYSSYEMDEEGEYKTIMKTKDQTIPTFCLSTMCYDSKKIITILEPLKQFGKAIFIDSGYVFDIEGAKFKLIFKNNLMVLTNDPKLTSRVPNFDQPVLNLDLLMQMKNKCMFVKTNNEDIYSTLTKTGILGNNFALRFDKIFEKSEYLTIQSENNLYQTNGILKLKNTDKNSLIEILDIAESLLRQN